MLRSYKTIAKGGPQKVLRALTLLAFILLMIKPAAALPQVRIGDIMGSPMRYHDMRVKVIGEVTKVEQDPQSPTGTIYTVQDSSDQAIHVRSLAAPELDTTVYVVGTVAQDDDSTKPYMIEIAHGVPGPPLPVLYGAGGTLIFIAVLLGYRIMNPKPLRKPVQKEIDSPIKRKPVITQVFRDDPVATLIATSGPLKGKAFNIYSGTNTVGRDDNQTVQITDDATVSRSHATIIARDGTILLTNHSATNPTKVDGEDVQEREIKDDDIIQIGSTKLRVALFSEERFDGSDNK